MRDIEIEVSQIVIYGDCKITAVPGRSCKKCFMHKETKYDRQSGRHTNILGQHTPYEFSNQCGASGNGRTCNLVCAAIDRRDSTNVIFMLVERLSPLERIEIE